MDTIRAFFTKSGHFFSIFKIGHGRPPPPHPLVARLKWNTILVIFTEQTEYLQISMQKLLISDKCWEADYPLRFINNIANEFIKKQPPELLYEKGEASNFIRKDTLGQVFSCKFC